MDSLARSPATWPQDIILGISGRCNYRCVTCNPHRHDATDGDASTMLYVDMPDEVFAKLEEPIRHARSITLSGVGEPMIAQGFLSILDRIRELNRAVRINVFSNAAALVNEDFVDRVSRRIDYLHVSINGLTAYDEIMVGGTWEKTLRNLRILRRVRRRTGYPARLEMGVVLMRSNAGDLVELAQLARDLGFDRIAFKDLWVFDENLESESLRHDPELSRRIRNEIATARDIGVSIRCEPWPDLSTSLLRSGSLARCAGRAILTGRPGPLFVAIKYWWKVIVARLTTDRKLRQVLEKDGLSPSPPACRNPWDTVQIDEQGDVLLCCNGLTRIGSMNNRSFLDVWNGHEANAYRSGMLNGDYYGACRSCKCIRPRQEAFSRPLG